MNDRPQSVFIPMCIPHMCKPWFAPNAARYLAKDARDAFLDLCGYDQPDAWKALKSEGWRIVRVKFVLVESEDTAMLIERLNILQDHYSTSGRDTSLTGGVG